MRLSPIGLDADPAALGGSRLFRAFEALTQ